MSNVIQYKNNSSAHLDRISNENYFDRNKNISPIIARIQDHGPAIVVTDNFTKAKLKKSPKKQAVAKVSHTGNKVFPPNSQIKITRNENLNGNIETIGLASSNPAPKLESANDTSPNRSAVDNKMAVEKTRPKSKNVNVTFILGLTLVLSGAIYYAFFLNERISELESLLGM